jgi:uncharacterized membrane protein YeaQ/YmgE (transglycosylase-associated protein family)
MSILIQVIILVAAMIVVGLLMGVVGGMIWKDNRPLGVRGDYIVAVVVAIVFGLIDWFIIPAMNFSNQLRNIAVATEPALGALAALWVIRVARR